MTTDWHTLLFQRRRDGLCMVVANIYLGSWVSGWGGRVLRGSGECGFRTKQLGRNEHLAKELELGHQQVSPARFQCFSGLPNKNATSCTLRFLQSWRIRQESIRQDSWVFWESRGLLCTQYQDSLHLFSLLLLCFIPPPPIFFIITIL